VLQVPQYCRLLEGTANTIVLDNSHKELYRGVIEEMLNYMEKVK
jgi:hypothetical protein